MATDLSAPGTVAAGFTSTAGDYDDVLRYNIEGAQRLVASLPAGEYSSLLDVGCGTGFASLAMHERFGITKITGADPSAGMLEQFAAKLGAVPEVEAKLIEADVLGMGVEPATHDVVISTMAFHWFPEKRKAMAAMAEALRPGGVLAILASGRGEYEVQQMISRIEPPVPPHYLGLYTLVQRDGPEMEAYIREAGLEVVDVWIEQRKRRTPLEALLERNRVVASHVFSDVPEDQREALAERFEEGMRREVGPKGMIDYTFTKLFAIARKPLD